MASTSSVLLLLVLVVLAGLADLQVVASPVDDAAAKHPVKRKANPELDGMMECMIGCFTTVMNCSFGCMGKGPDLPLCVISCHQECVVCMVRCGLTPSPPGPKPPSPPGPKPPSPKPAPPKPPAPVPGPPYAAHNAETSV